MWYLIRGDDDSIMEYSKNIVVEPGVSFKHAAYRTPKDMLLCASGSVCFW